MRRAGIPLDKRESTSLLACMLSNTTANSISVSHVIHAIWNNNIMNNSSSTGLSYLYCTSMASIGSDVRMGYYLNDLHHRWDTCTLSHHARDQLQYTKSTHQNIHRSNDLTSENNINIRHQLMKYGIDNEECVIINEQLLQLRDRYRVADDEYTTLNWEVPLDFMQRSHRNHGDHEDRNDFDYNDI
jgi:hypothetical protein